MLIPLAILKLAPLPTGCASTLLGKNANNNDNQGKQIPYSRFEATISSLRQVTSSCFRRSLTLYTVAQHVNMSPYWLFGL